MPRNPQGLYTLPAGNPVVPNTLIETSWANPTMEDIASALTGSLPRDGSAPMTGQLTLAAAAPTLPRHAVSKGYVEQFLAYATGMPVGAVTPLAGTIIPAGYLLCDGQAVPRADYPALFAAIGTTYGAGDSVSTFNVPDLRDWFIRGRSSDRPIGSQQAAAFASHNHPMQDPGHLHSISDPGHAHTAQQPSHVHGASQDAHIHGVSDPGHSHTSNAENVTQGFQWGAGGESHSMPATINAALTGISIQAAQPAVYVGAAQPGVTVNAALSGVSTVANVTGASIGVAGGTETRPQNVAMNYVIKAVNDSSQVVALTGITSSDDNMIAIDSTNPVVPMLNIKSNVAFGTVKLDASGQIPLGLLPSSVQQLLGYWDASGGQTPSQSNPTINYASGDTYVISVGGTLTVYDPVTLTASPTSVAVGSLLQYVENSITNPTGWYYVVSSTTVVASQVGFTPAGNIAANNVQAALQEVDAEKVSKSGDTMTGNLTIDTNANSYVDMKVSGVTKGFFYANAGVIGLLNSQGNGVFHNPIGTTDLAVVGNLTAANLSGTNTGNQTAALVPFTPAGNIAANNVQAAIQELDSEKVSKSGDTMSGDLRFGNNTTNGVKFDNDTGYIGGADGELKLLANGTVQYALSGSKHGWGSPPSIEDTKYTFSDENGPYGCVIKVRAPGTSGVGIQYSAMGVADWWAGLEPNTSKFSIMFSRTTINAGVRRLWLEGNNVGFGNHVAATEGQLITDKAGGVFHFGSNGSVFVVYNLSNVGVYLANGNTSWTPNSSDERSKRDFAPMYGLSELMQVEPIKYHLLDDEEGRDLRLGFKAQNIRDCIPEMAIETDKLADDGTPYLTVIPDYMIPVLVQAVKELSTKLDAAVAEIAALKAAK